MTRLHQEPGGGPPRPDGESSRSTQQPDEWDLDLWTRPAPPHHEPNRWWWGLSAAFGAMWGALAVWGWIEGPTRLTLLHALMSALAAALVAAELLPRPQPTTPPPVELTTDRVRLPRRRGHREVRYADVARVFPDEGQLRWLPRVDLVLHSGRRVFLPVVDDPLGFLAELRRRTSQEDS